MKNFNDLFDLPTRGLLNRSKLKVRVIPGQDGLYHSGARACRSAGPGLLKKGFLTRKIEDVKSQICPRCSGGLFVVGRQGYAASMRIDDIFDVRERALRQLALVHQKPADLDDVVENLVQLDKILEGELGLYRRCDPIGPYVSPISYVQMMSILDWTQSHWARARKLKADQLALVSQLPDDKLRRRCAQGVAASMKLPVVMIEHYKGLLGSVLESYLQELTSSSTEALVHYDTGHLDRASERLTSAIWQVYGCQDIIRVPVAVGHLLADYGSDVAEIPEGTTSAVIEIALKLYLEAQDDNASVYMRLKDALAAAALL